MVDKEKDKDEMQTSEDEASLAEILGVDPGSFDEGYAKKKKEDEMLSAGEKFIPWSEAFIVAGPKGFAIMPKGSKYPTPGNVEAPSMDDRVSQLEKRFSELAEMAKKKKPEDEEEMAKKKKEEELAKKKKDEEEMARKKKIEEEELAKKKKDEEEMDIQKKSNDGQDFSQTGPTFAEMICKRFK